MASPSSLREFRYIVGTTFNSTFTNAAADTWGQATKLQVLDLDVGGCKRDGILDATLQTRMFAQGAPIPGLSRGAVKFKTYATGAYSNVNATEEGRLMQAVMGGLKDPATSRNVAISAGSTQVNINVTGAGSIVAAGQAALIGSKGDGRGDGRAYPIDKVGADYVYLGINTLAAPSDGDQIVFSSTAYLDDSTAQKYIDWLSVGHATDDQWQGVGCQGTVKLEGTGRGDLPKLSFELDCADTQQVASGDRAALCPANVPSGGAPAFSKSIGAVMLTNYGSAEANTIKCGDLSFDFSAKYSDVPSPAGVNGIGGWQKIPTVPTMEATFLFDEYPELRDDFLAGTPKRIIAQFGHQQTKTVAIELTKAYVDNRPTPKAINNLSGVSVKLHGSDVYFSGNQLNSSPCKVHMF